MLVTDDVKFIKIDVNKRLLMANKYTFGKYAYRRYCCSKKVKGCKARILLNDDETVVLQHSREHNHEPPVYQVTSDGFYIKIKS